MEASLDGPRSPRPARGFTLIEIVVVLFILGVVIAMAATITSALTASQRLSTTTTRMQTVDAALVQFVMLNKRLPCPADGTLDSSTSANAGTENGRTAAGCPTGGTSEAGGVVPWRALGLAEQDATDGWNHRLTYRVQPALAADGALDMSWCDPAGNGGLSAGACNSACTSASLGSCTPPTTFLAGKGLEVHNAANTVVLMNPAATPSTGAAYVVISAGSSGGGAYLYSSGQLSTSTSTDGTQEQKNYASAAYVAGTTYYVDDSISEAAGTTHFDDIVSRPALLTVINKAGLGPRSHS